MNKVNSRVYADIAVFKFIEILEESFEKWVNKPMSVYSWKQVLNFFFEQEDTYKTDLKKKKKFVLFKKFTKLLSIFSFAVKNKIFFLLHRVYLFSKEKKPVNAKKLFKLLFFFFATLEILFYYTLHPTRKYSHRSNQPSWFLYFEFAHRPDFFIPSICIHVNSWIIGIINPLVRATTPIRPFHFSKKPR